MSYDPSCYDLAASFLSDSPEKNTDANRRELAQLIQDTIETHIQYGIPEPVAHVSTPSLTSGKQGSEA